MKNNNYQIQILKEKDWENWKNLKLQAFKSSPDLFFSSYEECLKKTDAYHKNEIKQNTVFGVFSDNELVGSIKFSYYELLKEKHKGYMSLVYLKPKMRGFGIGNKLLETIISYSKNKVIKLNLGVYAHNDRAISLYKKFGFKSYGIEDKALLINNKYYGKNLMSLNFE
ncbi:MAG: GNAT family N-acetyltransferase [Bacteroidetes bacterium]|nr:GNAT family N-acetyltransferase [Bacteroidota bacterium]